MNFEIKQDKFYKDGKEIKIISGAVHYFRNMPDTWGYIFKQMKALGCNCVETYCAWNMHEKNINEYSFDGILDVAEFIRQAGEAGLMVILRPGPYICAEWEFGGLPWWLQCDDNIEIRCSNKAYMEHFERYLEHIFDEVRPLLFTNGGPIIMMQCENEYGYYGDDKQYLKSLYEIYKKNGIDVPLFTSDGTSKENLLDGNIDGCIATLNFGSRVEENFAAHDELFPNQPKMCMEMWDGWFDAWGDSEHHTTSAEAYAEVVDDMLKKGSLNMYMFIGGTNFGFTSGANHCEKFTPDVTSYDYDALLSECGDVTPKFSAVREVIKKYVDYPLPDVLPSREKTAYGKVEFTEFSGLIDNLSSLSEPVYSDVPRCMEYYGQGYGYIAYCTVLEREYNNSVLSFESIGDRAAVYINKKLSGIVYVNDEKFEINFSAKAGDTLTIICENMGRANFGYKMMRKKGIDGRCLIDGKIHFNWTVYPLPMDNTDKLSYGTDLPCREGVFCKGHFDVEKKADTFLELTSFGKGFVLINGFNIGRYWEIGPQKRLFVPSSLLKEGRNEIIVYENDGIKGKAEAEFFAEPDLG